MTQPSHQSTKRVAGRQGKKAAQGKTPAKLLVAMTGKASAAKTAKGAEPVFAYIASLPQPQRGIAERIDALEGQRDRGVASVAMPFIRGSRIQTQKTGLGACHPTVRGEMAQNETREPFRRMWA